MHNVSQKSPDWLRRASRFCSVVAALSVTYGCTNLSDDVKPAATPTPTTMARATAATPPSSLDIYFQNWTAGAAYTQAMSVTDFKTPEFWDPNATVSIKQYDNTNQYKGMRAQFKKDKFGGDSGIILETDIAEKEEYTVEYKVFFEPGFQFNRGNSESTSNYGGGKLPGIWGGSRPGGGTAKDDGMSARIMFRKEESKYDSDPGGGYLEFYHYWRNQNDQYGERYALQKVATGQWYSIKMRIKVGTSTADGRARVWINNVLRFDRNFRYVKPNDSWKLNGILYHLFYGGNGAEWAPNADTYLILDNFRLYVPAS
jgi:hypothetical protein